MSDSLLGHLSALNDLVQDVIRENVELKRKLEERSNNRRKLSEPDVRRIRELFRSGMTRNELAESFDVNKSTISRLLRNHYHRGPQ